jgi:hypothetical protein
LSIVPKELLEKSEKIDRLLRRRKFNEVVGFVNEVLLEGGLGLSMEEVETITSVWERLKNNRLEKSKS